jgi:folate-binding protein YgfZ
MKYLYLMKFSTSTTLFRWKPAAWLRVTGADAASFLQGQFTNELRGLAAGESSYGLWLDVKGRVIADSFVVRGAGADEFWIGSYTSEATTIQERLESFVVADDVVVENQTEAWRAVTVWGNGVATVLAELGRAGWVFRGRRGRGEHMEWVFPMEAEEEIELGLVGCASIGGDEVERRRIEAGVPKIPCDIGRGELPNEGGLERDAISYTKGCYLGQEVMARLHAMGQVRRRLVRVGGSVAGAEKLPAALFACERQVGELRSAVDDGHGNALGLAMVSLLHVRPETMLSFAPDAAPTLRMFPPP